MLKSSLYPPRTSSLPQNARQDAQATAALQKIGVHQASTDRSETGPSANERLDHALDQLPKVNIERNKAQFHVAMMELHGAMELQAHKLSTMPDGHPRAQAIEILQDRLATAKERLPATQVIFIRSLSSWERKIGALAQQTPAMSAAPAPSTLEKPTPTAPRAPAQARTEKPERAAPPQVEAPRWQPRLPTFLLREPERGPELLPGKTHLSDTISNQFLPRIYSSRTGRTEPMRASMLRLSDNDALLMASMTNQGGFGKLRPAVSMATGERYFVKEFRKQLPSEKEGKSKDSNRFGDLRTYAPRTDVDKQRQAKEIIKEYTALRKFGDAARAVAVLGTSKCDYIVMHAMDSDLTSTFKDLNPQQRSAVARFVGGPLAKQMQQLHEHNRLHLDFKEENTLVDYGSKAVVMSDFGAMARLGDDGVALRTRMVTTLPAPELLVRDEQGIIRATDKADVWSLAVSVVMMLDSHNSGQQTDNRLEPSPFYYTTFDPKAYAQWFEKLPRRGFGVDLKSLSSSDANPFTRFFARVAEVDMGLANYMLTQGMHPDPDKRSSAAIMAAQLPRMMEVDSGGARRAAIVDDVFLSKKRQSKETPQGRTLAGLGHLQQHIRSMPDMLISKEDVGKAR